MKPAGVVLVVVIEGLAFAGSLHAAEPAADGAKLFQLHCQLCHGRDGKALDVYAKKGAPDLNDPEWQKARTDDDIRTQILEGSAGTPMKPFKKVLSAEKIEALVKFVRTLAAPAAK